MRLSAFLSFALAFALATIAFAQTIPTKARPITTPAATAAIPDEVLEFNRAHGIVFGPDAVELASRMAFGHYDGPASQVIQLAEDPRTQGDFPTVLGYADAGDLCVVEVALWAPVPEAQQAWGTKWEAAAVIARITGLAGGVTTLAVVAHGASVHRMLVLSCAGDDAFGSTWFENERASLGLDCPSCYYIRCRFWDAQAETESGLLDINHRSCQTRRAVRDLGAMILCGLGIASCGTPPPLSFLCGPAVVCFGTSLLKAPYDQWAAVEEYKREKSCICLMAQRRAEGAPSLPCASYSCPW